MKENQHFCLPDNINEFKLKMLNWVSGFSIFCFLDNSNYLQKHHSAECLLAAGAKRSVQLSGNDAFSNLEAFYQADNSWLFGHLGYNMDEEIDCPKDTFMPGFFFEPEIIIRIAKGELIIESAVKSQTPAIIYNAIKDVVISSHAIAGEVHVESGVTEDEYLQIVEKIKGHIKRGDCYELNFCQEFFAESVSLDPLQVYIKLQQISPNPFAAFYKLNDNYCMCASPERFLKKQGRQLISQPIKGTARRSSNFETDQKNKASLLESSKEKSENVMIVDLVRNDLSKVCEEGTVEVEEMFGIYAFPQVYQMISTIKGMLAPNIHFTKALQAAFPMGSMTGAPKKKVMGLIEKFERKPRGLFSGSIGYIDPTGDFDFNVVIRSIFYNRNTKYLSYWAGSAITFNSDPIDEYKECMAKVEAIKNALH